MKTSTPDGCISAAGDVHFAGRSAPSRIEPVEGAGDTITNPAFLHSSMTMTEAGRAPTIKGMFVKSHVRAVRLAKGEEGIRALGKCYGGPVEFRNSDDVSVRDEIRLIECALDVLTGGSVPPAERAFEAGRLHFRNFTTTPLGRILFALFRKNIRLTLLQSTNIAGHVFDGVRFSTVDLGPAEVRIRMENADYPIDHFRGLFHEWLIFSGNTGNVAASTAGRGVYEYHIRWNVT